MRSADIHVECENQSDPPALAERSFGVRPARRLEGRPMSTMTRTIKDKKEGDTNEE